MTATSKWGIKIGQMEFDERLFEPVKHVAILTTLLKVNKKTREKN